MRKSPPREQTRAGLQTLLRREAGDHQPSEQPLEQPERFLDALGQYARFLSERDFEGQLDIRPGDAKAVERFD
jgi:hypothetical protein